MNMKRLVIVLAALLSIASCRMIEPEKNDHVDLTVYSVMPLDLFQCLDIYYVIEDFNGQKSDTTRVEMISVEEVSYGFETRFYAVSEYTITKGFKAGTSAKVGLYCRLKDDMPDYIPDYQAPFHLGFSTYDYYGGQLLSRQSHFFTNEDEDGNYDYVDPDYVCDQINGFWHDAGMYGSFVLKDDPTYGLMAEFKGEVIDPDFWADVKL